MLTLVGSLVLWAGTDGFQAYTTEGARRYAIEKQPRELPEVTFQDQAGNSFLLSSLKEKYILFTFFYTRCGDVCPVLEAQFEKVVSSIPESMKEKDITFLSISFDPEHDDPLALEHYAQALNVDGIHWKIVTIPDKDQLQMMMDACGVVAIPNQWGGYEHNAAIYTADRAMRLIRIFDFYNTNVVTDKVMSLLEA
ncbi:MAG: SCO family protein [Paenibacillaceae bacterium]